MSTERSIRRAPSARPTRGQVIRDSGSFVLAWVLIFQQAMQPERFHVAFLVLAGIMSGVPAAVTAASGVLSRWTPGNPSTPTGTESTQ